jgi:putative ABC transport system substrate-binding protein
VNVNGRQTSRARWLAAVLLLLAAGLVKAGDSRPGAPPVLVVASVEVEAHRWAIEGIQEALGKPGAEIRIVDAGRARSEHAAGGRLAVQGVRVIIAVGSEAVQVVEAEQPEVPVISTMILRRQPRTDTPAWNVAATIPLDVSLPSLLTRLKLVFPGKTRLGIIHNPASGGASTAQMQARAQQLGFTVRVAECGEAGQLLAALASFKGQVDFVWCLPDGSLYNSATIKPLILASLEERLPLIGFSESFARAGAAVGVYPDFRDIGAGG